VIVKKLLAILLLLIVSIICLYFSSCSHNKIDDVEKISYNFQVRPIFSDKCFKCHGPDANKRQAGLRLDIEEEAYKALKEHPRAHAIVPGFPDSSEVYLRITSTDTDYRMPPVESYMTPLTGRPGRHNRKMD
jgi:hypothetical protein